MEGFKKLPKMQSFKIGGSVKQQFVALEKKERKTEEKADTAQDKAMVKKGVRQHETALHKGEPKTELKLKTGGRAKKAAGTVKKFEKASGEYGAKKTAKDKKNIAGAKKFVPAFKEGGKACAESAAKKVKNTPVKMCGGKSVKKMAEGKSVKQPGATEEQQKYYDKNAAKGKAALEKADYEAFGSRGDAARKGMEEGRMDAMGNAYKKGGKAKAKIKKYADGGAVLSDEEKAWLGGADATDPFILARMRSALGDKKPATTQGNYIPNANPAMDNRDIGQTGGNIDDESKWGNVSPAAAAFNRNIPGAGVSKPAAAPSAPVRQAANTNYIPNERPWTDNRDIGGRRFPGATMTPLSGKSYADLPSDTLSGKTAIAPYAAPNVEQDSGLAYPQGRNPAGQLPSISLPPSFSAANRTAQTQTTAPNLRESVFGNRPRLSISERLALLNQRKRG